MSLPLQSDCYKQTHWLQYPPDTRTVYSYLESRGGQFYKTLFFGLQIIMAKHLAGKVVTAEMLDEAEPIIKAIFGTDRFFNRKGWDRIVNVHGGRLPLRIRAIPEGSIVPVGNVLVTVENTDPELPWLTNFVETLLMQVWYPITVATLSWQIKRIIKSHCDETGCELSPFHLNDFGYRGVSSVESAGIGGCAHLVNFLGTDTIEGIRYAMKYYNARVCGHSVMASEHSTTTIFGQQNESQAYSYFMDQCPTGVLSLVSDSYDIMNACDNIFGHALKDKILARDGKLVVRPDSGDPADVTLAVLDSLWKSFGGTTNEMGFRVLHPKVGVIYGDGINENTIAVIVHRMTARKYATSNVVFGMGGALLQKLDRDTQRFAFKCSAANRNGKWVDVYKKPTGDSGKRSKPGRLKLINQSGVYKTVRLEEEGYDQLETVFLNGELVNPQTFEEVRNRASL